MGIIIEQYNITIGDIKDMDFITELNAFLGIILFLIILYCINKLLKRVFDIKTFKGKLFCLVATIIIMSILYALFEKPIKYIEGNFVFLYLSTATIIAYTVHKVIRFQIFHKKKYSISQLDYMEGHQFEYACADILKANAFKNVTVTQGSGDFGVDILAEKNGYKYAIQCKRYSRKLDNKPIQEVIGGLAYYGCNKGAVMTNQYFTEPAKELARVNNIELWDRDILISKSSNVKKEKINPEQKSDVSENSDSSFANNLLWSAISFILTTRNASTTLLQRKFILGFPHAARIVNEIEEMGIIGPQQGSQPREIYYTGDDLPFLRKKFAHTYSINAEEGKSNVNSDNIYDYAMYSTIVTNIEKNQKIYEDFIAAITDSTIKYFVELNISIYLEKIDIKHDTNEVMLVFSLKQYTSVSEIKPHIKGLAKYVGVKYSEFVYPTSTPYTIGIKMPLPEYLKETSTLIYKLNKEDEK